MRLRITVTAEIEVTDLADYDAKTLEEASENQQRWLDDGEALIEEVLGDDCSVTVEAVPE